MKAFIVFEYGKSDFLYDECYKRNYLAVHLTWAQCIFAPIQVKTWPTRYVALFFFGPIQGLCPAFGPFYVGLAGLTFIIYTAHENAKQCLRF